MKHVETDRRLANEYSKSMAEKVYTELRERGGFVVGPFPEYQKEDVERHMQNIIFGIVQQEYKKMHAERQKAQARQLKTGMAETGYMCCGRMR